MSTSTIRRSIHFATALLLSSSLGILPIREGRTETPSVARDILSLDCADADGKPSNNFERSNINLSIGKQFYRAKMRAYPGARIACELPIPEDPAWKPTSAVLAFGINDGRSLTSPMRVTAYANGAPVGTTTVSSGSVGELTILIDGVTSLALDVDCVERAGCNAWLYFTKAEVQYIWEGQPSQ